MSLLFSRCVAAQVRATYLDQQVENTFAFRKEASDITNTDVQNIAETLRDSWATNMLPNLSNQYTLREVYATDVSVGAGAEFTAAVTSGGTGSDSGNATPGNVSFCVSFRSGTRGRFARGRNYIVGITEDEIAGNILDTDWIASVLSAYGQIASDLADLGYTHVVLSRFFNNTPRTVGFWTPIIAYLAVDNVADSQRRRLPGRGR